MIKTKKGNVTLNGTGAELLTDFTMIAKSLVKEMGKEGLTEEQAKEELKKCVDRALMTDKELVKELADKLYGLLKDVCDKENKKEEN